MAIQWIPILNRKFLFYYCIIYRLFSLKGLKIAEKSKKVSTFVKFRRHLSEKMPEIPITSGDNPRRDRVFSRYGKPYE